jgi:predicted enzyme involved in methoxymalonyl-ACP biosynthesis
MRTQNIFIAHPQTKEEVSALKAFMQALKIKFEISKKDEYNPEFVEKIMESKKQIADGNFTDVKKDDLKAFIDSL